MGDNIARFTEWHYQPEGETSKCQVARIDKVDAVVCSGSENVTCGKVGWTVHRSNEGVFEIWDSNSVLVATSFCVNSWAEVTRADTMSSGIWNMKLNEEGHEDILFDLRKMEDIGPAVVYSHQDHVVTMPENSILLGSASHNEITALEFWTRMGQVTCMGSAIPSRSKLSTESSVHSNGAILAKLRCYHSREITMVLEFSVFCQCGLGHTP